MSLMVRNELCTPATSYWRHYAMSEERLEKVFQNTDPRPFAVAAF